LNAIALHPENARRRYRKYFARAENGASMPSAKLLRAVEGVEKQMGECR
jgi:hypothetical protein